MHDPTVTRHYITLLSPGMPLAKTQINPTPLPLGHVLHTLHTIPGMVHPTS